MNVGIRPERAKAGKCARELTQTIQNDPPLKRFLSSPMGGLLKIEGNCSCVRAKAAHLSGHLPPEASGNCAECLTEFTPMIGFLRSRFDQGQAMVAHPAPGVEDAQQEMEIYLASFA